METMTMLVRLSLFVSSFALAFGLAGVRVIGRDNALALLLIGAAALSLLPAGGVLLYASKGGDFSGRIVDFPRKGEAVTGYLMGYVLPIMLLDPRASSDVTAVALFLVVLSLTYAAADLHYLNPLLPLLGYRIWEVTVAAPDRRHRFVAITRGRQLTFETDVCVVGDGPVRLIRTLQRDEICG